MNAFSVDVEEWFQGIELSDKEVTAFPDRVEHSIDIFLKLLEDSGNQATFFILSKVAEKNPQLVQRIQSRGHEIATHGYSHRKIYEMTPAEFRRELRLSIDILENIAGEKVIGHRGAYFSITKKSLWALEIMAEEGLLYDSSIYPIINHRYGIPDANRKPSIINLAQEKKILEVPVSTLAVRHVNIPIGGGAYFRIYPYFISKLLFKCLKSKNEDINFYIHPWEIDPLHPKIKLPLKVSLTHYINLKTTERKLKFLLEDFSFSSYRETYKRLINAMT